MDLNSKINNTFIEISSLVSESTKLTNSISDAAEIIINCFKNNYKVIVFGNGGSAADAQHLVAEFVGRYKRERNSLPAISLTANTSIITAVGNDYGFKHVFERQCQSLTNKNDVVIAISTSGTSENVIEGIKISKKIGAQIIALTGEKEGLMTNLADIVISVPSSETPRIQEIHRIIMHIICDIVDEYFSDKEN